MISRDQTVLNQLNGRCEQKRYHLRGHYEIESLIIIISSVVNFLKYLKIEKKLPVNGQIKTEKFGELGIRVTEHGRKVGRPIFLGVNSSDGWTIAVEITVNGGSYSRKFGNQIHRIFINVLEKKQRFE